LLGQCLSYAELNQRANALAHHLLDLGVRPDDRVAIIARRGLDTLVGLLAILRLAPLMYRWIRRIRPSA
jgi:arthrofactin-type cyclic lipopeptide synthetase A